jgi:hypothetical protein
MHNQRVTSSYETPDRPPMPAGPEAHPAGMCRGHGHLVVYGNPAFLARYGADCIGLPAREALVEWPTDAFSLMDYVLTRGKPIASWIWLSDEQWRFTLAPRMEVGTSEVYGVSFHLRPRAEIADEKND